MCLAPPFEELLASHLPMIRRIAAVHEADPGARDDLVQDILYALWRALPGYRGSGPVRGFVARVATNRAATHVQRALRQPRGAELAEDVPADTASPEAEAIEQDQAFRITAAVRALPIALREPALLALEGLTQTEIATVLGITPNAVALRMARARAQLRQTLGET